MSDAPTPEETQAPEKIGPQEVKGVILIPYPKIVFMWPSYLVAFFCGLYMWMNKDMASAGAVNTCWIFMSMFTLNLLVLSFDFPRATSFLLFAVIAAFVLGGILLVKSYPDLLPFVGNLINSIKPRANATFYFLYVAVMTGIYIAVFLLARLDYWEVRPNELLHHHGVLSDLERFSAPHLRIDKEINDVFEYILAGSGRLILTPSNERRSIILENVFFISAKEKRITKLLGALQVQVREHNH